MLPVWRTRRTSLIAADGLTWNRAAAYRAELPSSTARTSRLRKSWDKGAVITASLFNQHPRIRTSGSVQPQSALDHIGQEAAEGLLHAVVDRAMDGDVQCADILPRRIWPARKGRPVQFDLPAMATVADLPNAIGAVAQATAAGELTPDEAQAIASVLEAHRRSIESADLAARIEALEMRKL